jgi:hypothetical protein
MPQLKLPGEAYEQLYAIKLKGKTVPIDMLGNGLFKIS